MPSINLGKIWGSDPFLKKAGLNRVKTLQELRMLPSSVTLNCQITKLSWIQVLNRLNWNCVSNTKSLLYCHWLCCCHFRCLGRPVFVIIFLLVRSSLRSWGELVRSCLLITPIKCLKVSGIPSWGCSLSLRCVGGQVGSFFYCHVIKWLKGHKSLESLSRVLLKTMIVTIIPQDFPLYPISHNYKSCSLFAFWAQLWPWMLWDTKIPRYKGRWSKWDYPTECCFQTQKRMKKGKIQWKIMSKY